MSQLRVGTARIRGEVVALALAALAAVSWALTALMSADMAAGSGTAGGRSPRHPHPRSRPAG